MSTTLDIGVVVTAVYGTVPSPVTRFDLRLPAGMGLAATTLGTTVCRRSTLVDEGITGCSPNAVMGLGKALVKVPFGPGILHERVGIVIFMGPPAQGHTQMLFQAVGRSPVAAEITFAGQLLPDKGRFGAHLDTMIPITPSVPGGPDAAVVWMQSSVGPRGLTYYKRVHGRKVAYHPKGMAVPKTCPRGGWPFAAHLAFQDGTTATATSVVRCPRSGRGGQVGARKV